MCAHNSIVSLSFSLALVVAGGCSSTPSGGAKLVQVSPMGTPSNIVRGGDHVAYLLNLATTSGAVADLHVAGTTMGSDVKVTDGIAPGGFMFSPDASVLYITKLNNDNATASLYLYDVVHGGAVKQIFDSGMGVGSANPSQAGSPKQAAAITAQSFSFSPSGKFFVVGVLADGVSNSPDLHVLETATGNDIFQRPNGAFVYGKTFSNDLMVFGDAPGGDTGPSGPPGVLTLYWVQLSTAGNLTPTPIDTRVLMFQATTDAKYIVYQRTDRVLLSWDTNAKPAMGTQLSTGTVQYSTGAGNAVYSTDDGGLHVTAGDGTRTLDLASAAVDVNSPVYISADSKDVYYFQMPEVQDWRGTLMHVQSSGGTPNKIDTDAGMFDLTPVPSGLLYTRNIDDKGTTGNVVSSARDGTHGSMLASGVPVGGGGVPGDVTAYGQGSSWVSLFMTNTMPNPSTVLIDGTSPTLGALTLANSTSATKVETATRFGDYGLDDEGTNLVWLGSLTNNTTVDNYTGKLEYVPVAMLTMPATVIPVQQVSELTEVKQRSLFVVSNAMPPALYYVTF